MICLVGNLARIASGSNSMNVLCSKRRPRIATKLFISCGSDIGVYFMAAFLTSDCNKDYDLFVSSLVFIPSTNLVVDSTPTVSGSDFTSC